MATTSGSDSTFGETVTAYVTVGTLGAMTWDVIGNLGGDYTLLFVQKPSAPSITYALSRLSTLAFILMTTVYITLPSIPNCNVFLKSYSWLFPISVSLSSLLFFFRLRAVFSGNKWVIRTFATLWLAVVGCSVTASDQHLRGGANRVSSWEVYCYVTDVSPYIFLSIIMPTVNDTLTFLAIAWRLNQNALGELGPNQTQHRFGLFSRGALLPRFSRSLLKDGQVYYLTIVTANMISLILVLLPIDMSYRVVFSIPNLALMNIMACGVFRNLKLRCSHHAMTSMFAISFACADVEAKAGVTQPSAESSAFESNQTGTFSGEEGSRNID